MSLLIGLLLALAVEAAAAAAPTRIVSLAPNLTELLFAAGAGDRVVGVTAYSDWPERARNLPRVGDAFRFDYEAIVALRPDLVLAWQSGTPAGAVDRLREAGLDVVSVPIQSLDGIAAALERIGELTGTGETARVAAAEFREAVARLQADHAGQVSLDVFIELDHRPLFTVTDRHLISEMVSICGGHNIFGSLPGLAPAVDLEAVVAARPDVILYTGPEPDPQANWRGWPSLPAVRDGNVLRVPGDLVSRASPRVVEGIATICEALDGARARRIR